MIIYKIKNKINGKIYIGQTLFTLEKRIKEHSRNSSCCPAIKNAIKKYGIDNFEIKVLINCNTQEELDSRENFCIRIFNSLAPNGYNLKFEGKGKGRYSEEVKKKISESVLKNHHTKKEGWISKKKKRFETVKGSPEFRKKLSKAHTGKKMSDEARLKMSESAKKRKASIETREKMSKAMTGRKISEEQKIKLRLANTGKKLTEDQKLKMKEAWKKRKERQK